MCLDAYRHLTCEWPSFTAGILAHLREKEVRAEVTLGSSAVAGAPFEPGWVAGMGFGSVRAVESRESCFPQQTVV